MNSVSFRIFELVKEVIAEHKTVIENKGLRFGYTFNFGSGMPEELELETDPQYLKQLLNSLFVNATNMTETGFVHLSVSRTSDSAGRCNIRFSVRDSGSGLSSVARERVFTGCSDQKVNGVRTCSDFELGFILSVELAQIIGGRILFISEVGKGSEFVVDVPCNYRKSTMNPFALPNEQYAHLLSA